MHRDDPRSGAMSLLLGLAVMIANPCWAQDQAGKAIGGPVASPIAACNEASGTVLDAGFGLRCGTSIPARDIPRLVCGSDRRQHRRLRQALRRQ